MDPGSLQCGSWFSPGARPGDCVKISAQEVQDYLKSMSVAANFIWVNHVSMTFLCHQVLKNVFVKFRFSFSYYVLYLLCKEVLCQASAPPPLTWSWRKLPNVTHVLDTCHTARISKKTVKLRLIAVIKGWRRNNKKKTVFCLGVFK